MDTQLTQAQINSQVNIIVERFSLWGISSQAVILFSLYMKSKGMLELVEDYDEERDSIIAYFEPEKTLEIIKDKHDGDASYDSLRVMCQNLIDSGTPNRYLKGCFEKYSFEQELYDELRENRYGGLTPDDEIKKGHGIFKDAYKLFFDIFYILFLPTEWVKDNYETLFYKLYSKLNREKSFDSCRPKELTELTVRLLDCKGYVVYNPYSGDASYGIALKESLPHDLARNIHLYGQEEDFDRYFIAKLRLQLHNCNTEWFYHDGWYSPCDYFDYMIASPDLRDKDAQERCFKWVDQEEKCIRSVLVFSNNMLFAKSQRERRIELLEKDLIETVILLPSKILRHSTVSPCIIVTTKEKKHKGYVKLINATQCYKEEKKKKHLDVQAILSLVNETTTTENSLLISNETIIANNANLMPSAYITDGIKIPVGYTLLRLLDLGTFIVDTDVNLNVTEGRLVTPKDLSDACNTNVRTANDFERCHIKPEAIHLESDAILLSKNGAIRPTLFSAKDGDVYLSNCHAFTPYNNLIPEYFVMELSKDYVQQQLTTDVLNAPDELSKVKILVPSIEQQRVDVAEYLAKLNADLAREVERLKTAQFDEYEKNMRLRKHALSQILNEIRPASGRLVKFITDNTTINRSDIVATRSGATFEQYLTKLNSNIEKICELVSRLTDQQVHGQTSEINLKEFLDEYIANKICDNYKIEQNLEYLDDLLSGTQSGDIHFCFSKEGLTTVFDNIFSNAISKGFTDSERKDYAIRIQAFVEDNSLRIIIANNGEPLPMGMTAEKVCHWGVGTNTGYGAWQAKQIVKDFGGTLTFSQNLEQEDGFIIEYELVLPII